MDTNHVARCGFDCSECPAYRATMAKNAAALEEVARRWGIERAEDLVCHGCRAVGQKRFSYCQECAIATCADSPKSLTCAHCSSYPCARAEALGPEGMARLDAIRAKLK